MDPDIDPEIPLDLDLENLKPLDLEKAPKIIVDDKDTAVIRWLWDWPWTEDGTVRCTSTPEMFYVTLEFNSLKTRDFDIYSFDKLKQSAFSCTVGLCSPDSDYNTFCRVEIKTFDASNNVCVEATRVVSRNKRLGKKGERIVKNFRKVYRMPESVDMQTLRAGVTPAGSICLQAKHCQKRKFASRSIYPYTANKPK